MMKKKIIIIILTIVTVCAAVIGGIAVHDNSIIKQAKENISVSDKTIELNGETVTVNISDVLNTNDVECTALFSNNAGSVEVNAAEVDEVHEKITVSLLEPILFNEEITLDVKIAVLDTTAPEFTESAGEITVAEGDEINVLERFKAQDLSGDVELKLEGEINTDEPGEQTVKVIATDKNGNTAEKEVKIIVEAKPEEKPEQTSNSSNSNNSASGSKSSSSSKTSSGTSSSKKSSSGSSGNSGSSSNSGSSGSSSSNFEKEVYCTNNNNHLMDCGNMGRWFNSKAEVKSYVDSVVEPWNEKWMNDKISDDEYYSNCPRGYECWSCPNCGKWTGNFKYR